MGLFGNSKNQMREEAVKLGLVVSTVQRELPILSRSGKFESLTTGECTRYALPRSSGTPWKLLQRDEKHGAQLSNGYLLEAQNITPQFLKQFNLTAENFPEEYFEFEGITGEVAVFWMEWGGKAQVERIYKTLLYLRDL